MKDNVCFRYALTVFSILGRPFQQWRLRAARVAARKLFSVATNRLDWETYDGIRVYYRTEKFRQFVDSAFNVLRENDRLDYLRLKGGLKGIVELGGPPHWAKGKSTYLTGFQIGVFLDQYTTAERDAFGFRRYAATLAGFAIRHRITVQMGQRIGWVYTDSRNKRILEIARKRELACCELVGCELSQINNMKRLIRNS